MLHSRCEDQIPVITLIPSDQGSVFPPGLFWLEQSVIWSVFTEDNIFIHILFTILENKWTDSILIKSLREKHQGKTWGCPCWYKNKLYGWNEYKQHMSIHSSDSYSAQQHRHRLYSTTRADYGISFVQRTQNKGKELTVGPPVREGSCP